MRQPTLQLMLGTALLAVTSQAFETEMQQHTAIHENLAQIEVQHLIAGSMGGLEPCETLPSCADGQYIYRTSEADNADDCTCRYLPQDCPCENQIFDVTTGNCVCEERECLPDFVWDYDSCKCECVHDKECPDNELTGQQYFWDRDSCDCQCKPEVCQANEQWSVADCACECRVRTDCPASTPYFDYDLCACRCEPLQCPMGQEFHFDSCQCECMYSECENPAYYFDTETCDCLCRPQECATGFYFNTEECECLCDDPANYADPCPVGEYFSTTHCECECDPTFAGNQCASGEFLDIETCQCVCNAVECTDDKIFNDNTCQCECCPKVCPDNFHWDDVECECVCSPVNCASGRYWNAEDCRCECQFVDCAADENNVYYFNTEECACKCSHRVAGKECAVGQVFDESICDCVIEPTDCAEGTHWDPRTGQCVCNVEICPDGQYWRIDTENSALCGCYCKPEYCAKGYHWDEDTCDCVCSMPANNGGCDDGQYWDSEHCRCLCEPVDCPTVNGIAYRLDDERCTCVCVDSGACDDGFYFDHETCECLCAPSEECAENKYWDTRTCGCLADPENCHCAIGFYFDFDEAECRCLPQECGSGLVWNSVDCACECEFDASCEATVDGVSYFWDADTCSCRCYYKEPSTPNHYFDMTDCVERLSAPAGGCQPINGNPTHWSVADEECKCSYQRSASPGLTFNVDICDFELTPRECEDESHYWDAKLGLCACYTQECPENLEWNKRMCSCICIAQDCPAGEVFDYACCMCRPCRDQGECIPGEEFFNPNTCSCNCLPESCVDAGIGYVWSYQTCQCEAPCTQADAVQVVAAGSTSVLCAEVGEYIFDFELCACLPITSPPNPCLVGSDDYDPFNVDCAIATGGVHAIGCEIWLNCSTDLDSRIIQPEGAAFPVVTTLDESQASGDICLDDSNEDYVVSKQLMGSEGQIPIDQFYFAEDRSGLGVNNIAVGGSAPNFPDEAYVYYLYLQSADRLQWNCDQWLSVKESDCLTTDKRVNVRNYDESQAVEMKIELNIDSNDSRTGGECVYWTISVNSIRGESTQCAGALLDIVSDTTVPGSGDESLWWTRDPSVYDDLFDPNPLGQEVPHKFRHRFRFDHMEDQGMFLLPVNPNAENPGDLFRYCDESYDKNVIVAP